MRAYNAGNKRNKRINRFLKGIGSLSLSSRILEGGVVKKKGNTITLKNGGFGCRPLVWRLADVLNNRSIILSANPKRNPYGISNAKDYLKEVKSMDVNRKVASKWLNDYETGSNNRYKVYCWVKNKSVTI